MWPRSAAKRSTGTVEIFGERPTVERTLRAVDGGQRYTKLSMFTIFSLFLSSSLGFSDALLFWIRHGRGFSIM